MSHVVVCAIIVRDRAVLLCHRSPGREWYPNVWDLPGGHVEAGEAALEALRREVREELGVVLGDVDRTRVFELGCTSDGTRRTAWVATEWSGVIANCAPDEHDRIGWFSREELGELAVADASYVTLLGGILDR